MTITYIPLIFNKHRVINQMTPHVILNCLFSHLLSHVTPTCITFPQSALHFPQNNNSI